MQLKCPISPSSKTPLLPIYTRPGHRRKPSIPRTELSIRQIPSRMRSLLVLISLISATAFFYITLINFHQSTQETLSRQRLIATLRHQREIDAKYCGKSPCKFLFPVWVGEQESKAQIHFHQLALLAKSLNRTVVLPNASKGRLGSCQQFPFSHYFTNETLNEFSFLTQQAFSNWLHERHRAPTAQFVMIEREREMTGELPASYKLHRKYCLRSLPLNYARHLPLRIPAPMTQDAMENFGEKVIKQLENDKGNFNMMSWFRRDTADVLLVRYDLRFPLFNLTSMGPPLVYDRLWYDQAMSVAESLRPFIAVHWRMETMPAEVLPECAVKLANHLNGIKQRLNISTVYLATDYPLEGRYAHSSTWHSNQMEQGHHEAIGLLKEKVDIVTWMTLYEKKHRDILNQTTNSLDPGLGPGVGVLDVRDSLTPMIEDEDDAKVDEQFDPGLLGILDKITAGQSTYFVTGPPECAKASSFTAQIVHERELRFHLEMAMLPEEGRLLKNVMEQW
ncbi:uncharacterized protein VTP21DRAFT_10041 [Calcarisporiella thermophila]|uniref:uncharacterized protein n=1 Tax=Calcarisporiella thermophila TaxID=911321 RepID=UPI003742C24E